MNFRTARILSNALFLAAGLSAVCLAWVKEDQTLLLALLLSAALLCLCGGFVVSRHYKCPFCGESFAARRALATPKCCPFCGRDLSPKA